MRNILNLIAISSLIMSILTGESRRKCAVIFTTVSFLALLQYIVFGIVMRYWAPEKEPPDRKTCDCTCWDTVFKGSYVRKVGGYYLHFYFNATHQTLKIWITVLMIIVVYEVISYILFLFINRRVRVIPFLLLLSTIHSHYYTWWVFVGYWNDDFYKFWNHQVLFSVTELAASAALLPMLDSSRELNEDLFLVISTISTFHIVMGGIDQFIKNVLYHRGEWHQRMRDLGFMSTDLISLAVSISYIYYIRRSPASHPKGVYRFAASTFAVFLLVATTKVL